MEIIEVKIEEILTLRNDYLKSLPQFQELYIELMVSDSQKYTLLLGEAAIGYAIITKDDFLIEFFLYDEYIPECKIYFSKLIEELDIKGILCKSFDALLLNCCLQQAYPYSLTGFLYRDYTDTMIHLNKEIKAKPVDESTIPLILQHKDCFDILFETEDYLKYFIKNDRVLLFFKEDNLVGCGIVIKTHPDWNYCDLGVWVHSDFRKKGIGTQIILELKEIALSLHLNPSCGCAVDNIASQKTIEKRGFISKYKLIEFKIPNI